MEQQPPFGGRGRESRIPGRVPARTIPVFRRDCRNCGESLLNSVLLGISWASAAELQTEELKKE